MLIVADVDRSIAFYKLLGFELVDLEREPGCPPSWARMHCEGGAIMLLRATPPAGANRRSVLFYLYAEDLPALREHLIASGVRVPEIRYPEHMASGEVEFDDPDGYAIAIGHWSDVEHQAWLQRLDEKGLGRPRT